MLDIFLISPLRSSSSNLLYMNNILGTFNKIFVQISYTMLGYRILLHHPVLFYHWVHGTNYILINSTHCWMVGSRRLIPTYYYILSFGHGTNCKLGYSTHCWGLIPTSYYILPLGAWYKLCIRIQYTLLGLEDFYHRTIIYDLLVHDTDCTCTLEYRTHC